MGVTAHPTASILSLSSASGICATCCAPISSITMKPALTYRYAKTRRSHAPSGPAAISSSRPFWADYTINMGGFEFPTVTTGVHNGDSNEKWIKETRLDISTGSRAEDDGTQENPRRPNCQKVETNRRGNAAESIQFGIVARLALTNRRVEFFQLRSPAPARGLLFLGPLPSASPQ